MKKSINNILSKFNLKIIKSTPDYSQYEDEFIELYNKCNEYSMASIQRMYSLYNAVQYILDNEIDGDFVECGVWRGGSSMLIASILKSRNITNRIIYMYDTFEGMSEPTKYDIDNKNESAKDLLEKTKKTDKIKNDIWCYADINDVTENMKKTNYNFDNIRFIKGKVEDTLLSHKNNKIALLRLDTDWYESTKIEMEILYPMLVKDGVLIIDDYGHWLGARKAIDEYLEANNINLLFNQIDYTGIITIKNL